MQWPPFTLFAYTDVRMREIWLRTIWQTENRQMENSVMSSNSFVTFFLLLMILIDGACRDCLVPVCFQCRNLAEDQPLPTTTVVSYSTNGCIWYKIFSIRLFIQSLTLSATQYTCQNSWGTIMWFYFICFLYFAAVLFTLRSHKKQPLMFSCITLWNFHSNWLLFLTKIANEIPVLSA